MKHSSSFGLVLGLLLQASLAAAAGAGNDDAEQRARLTEQRQQIEAGYDAALRACQDKFQVTDCELAAKAQRRKALAPIVRQEQTLDRAAREEQVRSSRERLAIKQLTHEGKAALEAASASGTAVNKGGLQPPSKSKPARQSSDTPEARQEQAARQAEQLKSAREQRIIKAREHEAKVQAREADLIARGKRAAPLPAPGVSAQASSSTH